MSTPNQVECPNCGTDIDVQNILSHQLEDEIKRKYQAELSSEKKRYQGEQEKLRDEKVAFEEKKRINFFRSG